MHEEAIAAAAMEVAARLSAAEPPGSVAESIYEGSAERRRFFVIAAFSRAGFPLRDAIQLVNSLDPDNPDPNLYT